MNNSMCDMAMFPNATHGYMPFVHDKPNGKNNKRSKIHVNGGKLNKGEIRKHAAMSTNSISSDKMYQLTLKDKNGRTYRCIVKGDSIKSLPDLCEKQLNVVAAANRSLPDISALSSPEKQRQALSEKLDALNMMSKSEENFSTSLDLRNCGKKEGIFRAFFRFIKEKTTKHEKANSKDTKVPTNGSKHKSNGKSKRKNREPAQRKRQRTVSAMSNLDPIEEAINEHEYEEDDNDSYTHYSSSSEYSSDNDSVSSQMSCTIEQS